MDQTIARQLVRAFKEQFKTAVPDTPLFLDVLVDAEIPESERISEELPERQQTITDGDKYHHITLRRVLRNYNARSAQLSGGKKALNSVISALGIYSSDALTRKILSDAELVELMASSTLPFSLLGKFETYDSVNLGKVLYRKTQPILVIPGASDWRPIARWEDENTTYEKETGFFMKTFKRIDKLEYLAQ